MLHGEQRDRFDLSFCLPSECADRLHDGRADIGIIPAIELPRQDLVITADTGIICRGADRSILLISHFRQQAFATCVAGFRLSSGTKSGRAIGTGKLFL